MTQEETHQKEHKMDPFLFFEELGALDASEAPKFMCFHRVKQDLCQNIVGKKKASRRYNRPELGRLPGNGGGLVLLKRSCLCFYNFKKCGGLARRLPRCELEQGAEASSTCHEVRALLILSTCLIRSTFRTSMTLKPSWWGCWNRMQNERRRLVMTSYFQQC